MMKRDMLRQLASFHAVGAERTISAAARLLGKSPPAVHHDLGCLEQRLGEKLFHKAGRYLSLTPAARRLHIEVGRSLDQLERHLDRFSRSLDQGPLRIGAVAGFGRYRLAPLLFAAADERQVDLLTGAHEDIVSALLADRIDAGVTYKAVVATPIECEPVADEEIVLLARAGTPPVGCSLSELQALEFVTYDEHEYVFARWFDRMFGKQPAHLRRSDHVSDLEEAMESVAQGRGFTILPADAWNDGPWRTRCCAPLEPATSVRNSLFLLSLPGKEAPARAFIRSLFA